MICKKCGLENKDENKICEGCGEALLNEEKSLLDRLLALSAFTFGVVALLSFLLLLTLYLFR